MQKIQSLWYSTAITSLSLVALGLPSLALAAGYTPLAPVADLGISPNPNNISAYLNGLFRAAIIIAGIAAVFVVMWAGLQFMTTQSSFDKSESRKRITGAVAGLLLALFSWLILQTINPQLLNNNLTIEAVNNQPGTADNGWDSPEPPKGDDVTGNGDPNMPGTPTNNPTLGEAVGTKGTSFGYLDPEDNGEGSPILNPNKGSRGISTNNQDVVGVALPVDTLMSAFGLTKRPGQTGAYEEWAVVRNSSVSVRVPGGEWQTGYIVDLGPGSGPQSNGVGIDLTRGMTNALGLSSASTPGRVDVNTNVEYRINQNAFTGR